MEHTQSYTSQLKQDILQHKPWRTTYKKQLACGLLWFCQRFEPEAITLTTMDSQAARFCAGLIPRIIPLTDSITTTEVENAGRIAYTVTVDGWEDRISLLNYFAMLYPEGVTFDLLGGESGTAAFLAGAFLACGSFGDPNKQYHLEFALAHPDRLEALTGMMADVGFLPRTTERRGLPVCYFHDSQQIEDVLAFLGSSRLSLELMQIKIYKERRNAANRASNCDSANIDKTLGAATVQIAAIRRIYDQRGEDYLPEGLRELAALRLAEPELSLRELGQRLTPALSRSGVNHRLEKLVAMAAEIK